MLVPHAGAFPVDCLDQRGSLDNYGQPFSDDYCLDLRPLTSQRLLRCAMPIADAGNLQRFRRQNKAMPHGGLSDGKALAASDFEL